MNLQIDKPVAFVATDRSFPQQHGGTKESVLNLDFRFTDIGPLTVGSGRVILAELNERLTAVIGTPTWSDVSGRAAWCLRRAVMLVEAGDEALYIDLVNPPYQRWHDKSDATATRPCSHAEPVSVQRRCRCEGSD
ncbi:MAG: hypothetical protein JWN03_7002 [Nocardia sp.]|uniref:hypothetical protein n=1 Tax=Nocardia sp. TaxID=1821 RepID=UPI002613187C|nr:hypothetical protein [Nocardia sp.]MCU1646727.1 hypothetical protein [Nocardia sp.]